MSPWWWWPDGTHVYLAEGIRKSIREEGSETQVIVAGKIRDPKHAEEILNQGKADMIGFMPRSSGRSGLASESPRGERKRDRQMCGLQLVSRSGLQI